MRPGLEVERFILCFLRSRWEPGALDEARHLVQSTDVNWGAVIQRIQDEGLGGLIYHQMRDHHLAPAAAEATLAEVYYRRATRNALLLHELEEVVADLQREGVRVVLLKGVALALTVYESVGLRQIGDVDLLVHSEDISRAQAVLTRRGYSPDEGEVRQGDLAAYESQAAWRRAGPVEFILELHWSLFDSPHHQVRGVAWFWQSACPTYLGTREVWVLGIEAQVLHLCAHVLLHHPHAMYQMRWLHDVAEILAAHATDLDWRLLFAQANAHDLVLPLQLVLTRVLHDWQLSVPDDVAAELRDLQPSASETRVFRDLATARSVAARFWADVRGIPQGRDRLAFTLARLFPSPAYMRQRYHIRHRGLIPFYYPYRWYLGIRSAL